MDLLREEISKIKKMMGIISEEKVDPKNFVNGGYYYNSYDNIRAKILNVVEIDAPQNEMIYYILNYNIKENKRYDFDKKLVDGYISPLEILKWEESTKEEMDRALNMPHIFGTEPKEFVEGGYYIKHKERSQQKTIIKVEKKQGDNLTYTYYDYKEFDAKGKPAGVKFNKEAESYTSQASLMDVFYWEKSDKDWWDLISRYDFYDDVKEEIETLTTKPKNFVVGEYYMQTKEDLDSTFMVIKVVEKTDDKVLYQYYKFREWGGKELKYSKTPVDGGDSIVSLNTDWKKVDKSAWDQIALLPYYKQEEEDLINNSQNKKEESLVNQEDFINVDQSGKEKYLGPLGEYEGDFKDFKFHGKGKLNTNVSELDQEVFNPITKNFHDQKFVYEGDFVDGNMEGKGIITFQDKSKYNGTFKDNKIEGFGTFTFPDMSTYEGIFETNINSDGSVTYSYETSDGLLTDDIVGYNEENIVQQIKFSEEESENFSSVFDLKINIISGDKNEIIGGVSGQPYAVKNTEIEFKNTVFKNKSFKIKTSAGQAVLSDFELGNYDIFVNVPGVTKIKQNMIIGKQFINGMTIKVKPTVKENYLTEQNKFRKLTKEEKVALNQCEIQINEFYKYYSAFYKKTMNFETNPEQEILDMRDEVTACITNFYNHLSKDTKKIAKQLTNVGPTTLDNNKSLKDYFDINFNINENKDIYIKTNDMGISNSIKKIIREHAQKKQDHSVEKTIIENRLKFVIKNSKNSDLNRNVINESIFLTQRGYDKKLIKNVLYNLIY